MVIRLAESASAFVLACALALGPGSAAAAGGVAGKPAAAPATDAVPPSPADLAGMLPAICGRERLRAAAGRSVSRCE